MGLDMYLFKTAKMEPGFDYTDFFNKIDYDASSEEAVRNCLPGPMVAYVTKYENMDYYRPYTEVAYWRKFNALHNWFVNRCQNGVDECQYSEVEEEDLKRILAILEKIKKKPDSAEDLLPTQEGFFFGSADYNEWYFENVKNAIKQISRILEETDFEKEIILYHSSW